MSIYLTPGQLTQALRDLLPVARRDYLVLSQRDSDAIAAAQALLDHADGRTSEEIGRCMAYHNLDDGEWDALSRKVQDALLEGWHLSQER